MKPARTSTPTLSGRIFSSALVFTLGVVLVLSLVLTFIYYVTTEQEGENRLMQQARDAAASLNAGEGDSDLANLQAQFDTTIRFTLIDADGAVLFDSVSSDASALENHANRPEVIAAKESGEGAVTRYSSTLKTDTVYAAVCLDDGSVIRLSETRDSLLSFTERLVLPIVVALVVAALAVMLLSRVLTRRIMKPIDALDFTEPLNNNIYGEMVPLLTRIDEQQRQLKSQNKQLAHAESLRRDFSANVSHEMKTPLQVISGYAELMRNGMVPPEDMGKFSGLIYDESQAMRSLINDVLVLSRLDETSFSESEAVPVDAMEVAQRVAGRLKALAAQKQVQVRVVGTRAVMAGNDTLIEEMLYNLVENGIRYNHEGGHVLVSVGQEEVSGVFATADRGMTPQQASQMLHCQADAQSAFVQQRQVVICVSDTGPGIPPDKRDKIFERFYRMEKSRSKETGGTGLGLAIVKHAVLYHNGTIEVSGEEGSGAIFTLRFPAL